VQASSQGPSALPVEDAIRSTTTAMHEGAAPKRDAVRAIPVRSAPARPVAVRKRQADDDDPLSDQK
jgi:hypothetical protein